jgi:hypothetical protein
VWKDGSPLTLGGTGYGGSTPVNYAFSGDPSNNSQWSECAENNPPYDRRMIISSGPFMLEENVTQTFDVAVLWDQNSIYPCPSFTVIGDVADCVQNYFDNSVVFTGIDDGPLQTTRTNTFNVFPNPSGENEVISFQFDKARYLEIFDIAGRKVEAATVSGLHDYAVKSRMVNGLYIYKILFSDGTEKTGKLVVQ